MPVVRISDELFHEVQKYAEPLIDNFESALWKALRKNESMHSVGQRKARSRAFGELTSPATYWKLILEALVARGGRARRQEIHDDIEHKMKGQFKPGDTEKNLDGTLKWNKQVDYQRLAMVREELLRNDSPLGVWEISESGRQWFSSH